MLCLVNYMLIYTSKMPVMPFYMYQRKANISLNNLKKGVVW